MVHGSEQQNPKRSSMISILQFIAQDQVQSFNAKAQEFHHRSGDGSSAPFRACLLGSAQRDDKIIDSAVRGECCHSSNFEGC